MVNSVEDLGVHMSMFPSRAPFYTYRFGAGHDGEHWLTKTIGAEVRATPGIQGVILTHYYQGDGVWNVMILLDKLQIVLLIKDLINLGPKFTKTTITSPDNKDTPNKDESKFTDRNGMPTSKVRINSGDLIGKTSSWEQGKFGTFHFALLKYEKIQEYRSKVGAGASGTNYVFDIDIERKHIESQKKPFRISEKQFNHQKQNQLRQLAIPIEWFIPVLGPDSPVRCFK